MPTIGHNNGFRASAESSFLHLYLGRPNLAVFNHTLGERIIFDEDKVEVTTATTAYTPRQARGRRRWWKVFVSATLIGLSLTTPE